MALPEHRALPLATLRGVVAAEVPTRIGRWLVVPPGRAAPWPDRLTAVPFLTIPLSGSFQVPLADGREEAVRRGEAVAYLAGSHATTSHQGDGRVVRVTLDRPLLYWAVGSVRKTAAPDFRDWDYRQEGLALARDGRHRFDDLLEEALKPPPPGAAGWREDLVAAAWQLLRAWLAADERATVAGSRAEATWQLATDYLRDHLAAATRRQDVAAALGLHPNYLSDLCRRCTGRAYADHVRDLRLDRAELLLRETDLGIRRIAAAVGWSSDGYLERRFRERHGMTPARWRRRLG